MIDKTDAKWIDFVIPNDVKLSELIEIFNLWGLRINVNSTDIETKDFIYRHKKWFKLGGE